MGVESLSGDDLTGGSGKGCGVVAIANSRSVTIRKATSVDAFDLADLASVTYAETFAKEYPPGKLEQFLSENFAVEIIRKELNDENVLYLVAEENSNPVGYAKLVQKSAPSDIALHEPIELERLYILKNWHGSGLANRFMNICIAEAQLLASKTLWLAVWEHNNRAKAFYSREGFREVDVTKVCSGVKLQVMTQEL